MSKNQYFKQFSNFINNSCMLNSNSFNIISFNIRSVSSIGKFDQFKELIARLPKLPDVIALQETWFNKDITQIYEIPGFTNVHCCREDGYGGTSLYINKNIHYEVDICKSEKFVERIVVTFCNVKVDRKPLKLISLYRSQKCNVDDFINIVDDILNVHARNPIIIVGDSNVDSLQNTRYIDLLTMFQNYDCDSAHNLITRPQSKTSIDQVFSNFTDKIYVDSVECILSDHNIVCCKFESSVINNEYSEMEKTHCDYMKARGILRSSLPENYSLMDVSELTNTLVSCMKDAVNDSMTVSNCKKQLRFQLAPWINKNLQELILLKEKILRKRRKSKGKQYLEDYLKRISKVIKIATKKCRDNYYSDSLSRIKNDPKKTWKFINSTLGRKKNNEIHLNDAQGKRMISDQAKVDCFNNYFLTAVRNLKRGIEICPGDNCNFLRTLSQSPNRFTIENISCSDVIRVILSMDINKSPGYDNISPKFVRECREEIAPILCDIFNKMINNSVYPDVLKVHKLVPIPKEINVSTVDKYRPIAVLSSIDKIFEKILYDKLLFYLEENNFLYNFQYGFRRGCGTEDAVLNVVKNVCKGLDDGFSGVAGIFFDFTKAFDLVDHQIMLQKLKYYGIQGRELLLFESYFTNRKQFVNIKNAKSFIGSVEYGVPQGSGLGPLLFSIYLNDISNLNLSGQLCMFADDVCVLYPYKHDLVLKTQIERDAALIFEFARLNRLLLNPGKTNLIRFRPHSLSINNNFNVYVDGNIVHETHSIKYLGIILQSNLSWDLHISNVKRKIAPAIGILYKFKNKLGKRSKLMIYQSLIQSHLNYLAIIYAYNKNNVLLKSLQCMQNKALKIIYNLPLLYSTISLYKEICKTILPIYGLHEFQVLMFVFKCINNIGYHTIPFTQNQINFNTRNRTNLRIPRCRLETTKQRIDYIGGTKFNNLPTALKLIDRISIFKSSCREYLYNTIETLLM